MSATITIPADLEQQVLKRALGSGQKLEEFVINALRAAIEKPFLFVSPNHGDNAFLDVEYMSACGKEADASVTLASVRQILEKIPDSLADAVITERDERC